MINIDEIERVKKEGMVCIPCNRDGDLLHLAQRLGPTLPSRRNGLLVDRLSPVSQQGAKPNSMSAIYGLEAFPFHTDQAHWRIPPRFIVLRLADGAKSSCPTLIQDMRTLPFSAEELAILRHNVWFVSGGYGRFFTSIIGEQLSNGESIGRYDPVCMRPAHPAFIESSAILQKHCTAMAPVIINWTDGNAVVLDNWRMLHARGIVGGADSEERVLLRVLVQHEIKAS